MVGINRFFSRQTCDHNFGQPQTDAYLSAAELPLLSGQ